MATAFVPLLNSPNLRGDNLIFSRTLPLQTVTNNSTAFDLGGGNARSDVETQQSRGSRIANYNLVINWGDLTVNTAQTVTLTLQDSADNSTFAALAPSQTFVITGASNIGPAGQWRIALPENIRRYVRFTVAASATAGTVATETIQSQLVA